MRVALIQFNAGADKEANVRRSLDMVREALAKKAQFILLPEVFNFRGDSRNKKIVSTVSEHVPGASSAPFISLAAVNKAHILLGSIFEQSNVKDKAHNTSILINSAGKIIKKYRKIHLFDACIGDKIMRESDCFVPGSQKAMAMVDDFKVGLSICYDLRFPELYRNYGRLGADILTVPSCFTKKTGQAHWEVLLRARAVENLAYVLAPNQVGADARGVESYGNSMIVSPWGEVIARGSDDKEEIIYGDIEQIKIDEARNILPGVLYGKAR